MTTETETTVEIKLMNNTGLPITMSKEVDPQTGSITISIAYAEGAKICKPARRDEDVRAIAMKLPDGDFFREMFLSRPKGFWDTPATYCASLRCQQQPAPYCDRHPTALPPTPPSQTP